MQNCLAEWQTITSNPFILQCITNCEIEFDYIPRPSSSICCLHPEHKFSLQEQHTIDVEIGKFLEKQIIELTEAEPGQIISPLFLTPKKEPGTFRVIFNLKHLNQSVTYRKFKMDTLESAIKLMKPGCYMTCVDLQDAYYSIPMSPLFRKYLKFAWRGRLYQFRALPMGLTSSPRIFTKYSSLFLLHYGLNTDIVVLVILMTPFILKTRTTIVKTLPCMPSSCLLNWGLWFIPQNRHSFPLRNSKFWAFY